ncbi:hypothetical protein BC831DRAFT_509623 [Entophlyctis helioformis]|nr:hypothetical protein BC831DRAFT_509623 [Entophlyctis helioformis]
MSGIIDTAKSAASSAVNTASSAANTAVKTASSAVNYATSTATSAVNYATSTASSAVNYATSTASSAARGAASTASSAVNYATTTVTAYTPGPIVKLVQSTVDGAKALGSDPVGTVKPYVPTFVIHAGEKTYEIVQHTKDRTTQNVSAATGFIVTKVNGTVKAVTSVPAIGSLIDQLNKLTTPILTKLGVKKAGEVSEGEVVTDVKEVSAATEKEL